MSEFPNDYTHVRDTLERMERRNLEQAADLGRLFTQFDFRTAMIEQTLKDVRLTLTGIGSLAKSLAERQSTHEDILKGLAQTLQHQNTINERQLEFNQDVKTTLARIEALLDRMLHPGGNGEGRSA